MSLPHINRRCIGRLTWRRLLISSWYKPSEIAVRVAIVYCGNTVANGFGGLLAAGIMSGLNGKGGLEGWRSVTLFSIFLMSIPSTDLTEIDGSSSSKALEQWLLDCSQ